MPTMESGDILGHEFMGEVIEPGKDVKNLKKGDRVVVPFNLPVVIVSSVKKVSFHAVTGLLAICDALAGSRFSGAST